MDLDRASLERALAAAGCITPSDEADALLQAAGDDPRALTSMLERRIDGEPLAWITGSIRFCGLDVRVTRGVYAPRWQTEPLARRAASLLPSDGAAVDLCTGAGAVAMVLNAAAPNARVVATDVDPLAVACARTNGVEAYAGILDEPLPRALEAVVDVLTAVPPYVPTGELRYLPRDVQAHEPIAALDGGADGTDVLAEIVRRAPRWLRSGGALVLELGGDQATMLEPVLRDAGFDPPEVLRDAEEDPRGILARLAQR
ncbi:MAG TPA: HemK/PrmC family methyltransferase [Actinomycetota bacterium]|nr:HemK/PrmC family methyltransferase [Actinomycetota bacterium]